MNDIQQSKDQKPKTKDKPVAAMLLAAGLSRRMGAFKPLLPFGNKTVVESCVDYLKRGGVETIVVVLGHREDEVRAHLTNSPVLFALNPDPSSEMADSIRCGAKALPSNASATLIALVDHPAVPGEVVSTLIDEWKKGRRLIIPTWHGRGGHPVLVDLSFREELENLDAEGGLKSFFQKHVDLVSRIEMPSPYIARDMDTWDDYARLYFEVFGQAPMAERQSNESPHSTI